MKKYIQKYFIYGLGSLIGFSVLLGLVSFSLPKEKRIKIYLIGDSTMCLYDKSRFPLTGWGMPFVNYFDSSVKIDNRAKGGRSTKTFISEKLWQPVADSLQAGDYVIMQFGHNDAANSAAHPARYASPEDYKKNLLVFITETRQKKATPILVTPVTRRKFDTNGKVEEGHAPYSKAVAEVAAKYKVPLIDLDRKSRELVQQMGPEGSKYLYMEFEPGENPIYPAGMKDITHLTEFGARKMAEIVLSEIKAQNLELANYIVKGNKQ